MFNNIYVYGVDVAKWGEDEKYKTFYLLAGSMFEASHIAEEHVYDDDRDFSETPCQITNIFKVKGIDNVINGNRYSNDHDEDGEYDPEEPLEMAKNMPDERVIKFKCSCKEEIRVADFNWPYIICPNCENQILRREIADVGGFYIYKKLDDKKS